MRTTFVYILAALLIFPSTSTAYISIPKFKDGKAVVSETGAGPHGWGEYIVIDKTGKRLEVSKEKIDSSMFSDQSPYTRFYQPGKGGKGLSGLKNRKTDEVLVKPTWYRLQNEAEDLEGKHCVVAKRVVVNRKSKAQFGAIDLQGKVVVEPVWDAVYIGTGAKSWLVERDGKFGLVTSGRIVAMPTWEKIGFARGYFRRFSKNGLLPVMKEGKWGYVDVDGNVVIGFQFEEAGSFRNIDRAIVLDDGSFYLIKPSGEKVVKLPGAPWYEREGMLEEVGPYIPIAKGGKWGCADLTGKLVIPFEWNQISSPSHGSVFSEGMAVVKKGGQHGKRGDGEYGFVDERGKLVIFCTWDLAGNFSEGLAYVEHGGRWGFIDKTGKVKIGPIKIKEKKKGE